MSRDTFSKRPKIGLNQVAAGAAMLALATTLGCAVEVDELDDESLEPSSSALVSAGTTVAAGDVRIAHSGQCMDIWQDSQADYGAVYQYPCHGGANQAFNF